MIARKSYPIWHHIHSDGVVFRLEFLMVELDEFEFFFWRWLT